MKNLIILLMIILNSACSSKQRKIKENDIIYGVEAINGYTFKAQNEDKTETLNIRIYGVKLNHEKFQTEGKENLDSIIANKKLIVKKIYEQTEEDIESKTIAADVWFTKNDGEEEDYSDKIDLNIAVKILASGLVLYDKSSKHKQRADYVNAQVLGMQTRKGIWSNPNSFE